jgi:hypothetical protein
MDVTPEATEVLREALEWRLRRLRGVVDRLERASRSIAPEGDDTRWRGPARRYHDDRVREVRVGLVVAASELHGAIRETSRALVVLAARV